MQENHKNRGEREGESKGDYRGEKTAMIKEGRERGSIGEGENAAWRDRNAREWRVKGRSCGWRE